MSRAAELVDRSLHPRESGKPSSSQLDSSLQHFSDPSFDPVDYLNDTLPAVAINAPQPQHGGGDGSPASLADISTQAQSLVSQLSAQNARLSNTLTQLTDEILRGGGRLAYEVEVLRGETVGLSDAVSDVLQDDIRRFVPEGITEQHEFSAQDTGDQDSSVVSEGTRNANRVDRDDDPEYITRLRTLSHVKARLDEVVQIFGEAMKWPLPPSEVSVASSFISVSAPEHGLEDQDLEEKGREAGKKLRMEVIELLESEGGGEDGLAAASRRVESLRLLASVWKGTAEEKARIRFVEGLSKVVEERRRVLESQAREKEAKDPRRELSSLSKRGTSTPSSNRSRDNKPATQDAGGGGLFRNLQRLRDEIYLE